MATDNSSSAQKRTNTWTSETGLFLHRLYEVKSVLSSLINTLCEYSKDDGRPNDKAIYLVLQQSLDSIQELETRSYELDKGDGAKVGQLSLYLMWARALLSLIEEPIGADSWEIRISDNDLCGSLTAVLRRIDQAYSEAARINEFYFKKVA